LEDKDVRGGLEDKDTLFRMRLRDDEKMRRKGKEKGKRRKKYENRK
jgi:hypothetical protein